MGEVTLSHFCTALNPNQDVLRFLRCFFFKYSVYVTFARKQGSGVGLAFRFSGGHRRFSKGSGDPSPLT